MISKKHDPICTTTYRLFLLSLVQEAFWQFKSLNKVEKISYFEGNKVKKEYLQQKEKLNEKGTFRTEYNFKSGKIVPS